MPSAEFLPRGLSVDTANKVGNEPQREEMNFTDRTEQIWWD